MIHLSREGQLVTLEVSRNGAKSCDITLWRAGTEDAPLVVDSVNIISERARRLLVEKLPEDVRDDAAEVLLGAALELRDAADGEASPKPERALVSARPWDHAVDGAVLLDDLVALIRGYMVLPDHAAEAIALWILHTYAIDAALYTPYLLVTSPVRECGKTTLLELLEHLAHRAYRTDSISAAALYRKIHRESPTVLLDELDARLRRRDGAEDLRGVLNSGFKRGGKHTICVGDEHDDRDFSTFSPKVLSGIGRVWDTVTSRSIPVRLARASRVELPKLRRIRGDHIAAQFEPYRRRAARWAADHAKVLADADPVTPVTLGARQADVWRPLLAIADSAGGCWPEYARNSAFALHRVAQEEGDYGLLLLTDLEGIYSRHSGGSGVWTSTILDELTKREDRPWPEYREGRPMTPNGLASLLRRFDIRPETIREEPGEKAPQAKGYHRAKLEPLFITYLTQPAQPSQPSQPKTAVAAVTAPSQATSYEEDERAAMQDEQFEEFETPAPRRAKDQPCRGGCGLMFFTPNLTCPACHEHAKGAT